VQPPSQPAPAAAAAAAAAPAGGRVFASPLARKVAAERSIDLARLTGTGPSGRILAADVHEAQLSLPAAAAVHPTPTQPAKPDSPPQPAAAAAATGDYTDGKLTNVRKVRARASAILWRKRLYRHWVGAGPGRAFVH
jgi:pyruvate dehydrogenase E2 component (dihydrolipoamide acetyltransferase)